MSKGNLQDRQHPIDREILNLLISSTPEEWKQIDFSADVTWFDTYEGVILDITSPEGHDAANASVPVELSEATAKLVALMKEYGLKLKSIRGRASLGDDGRWRYDVDFDYWR